MFQLIFLCVCFSNTLLGTEAAQRTNTAECLTNSLQESVSLYCRGSRMIRNVIQNLSKTDKAIVLVRGLEIVPSKEHPSSNHSNHTTTPSASAATSERVATASPSSETGDDSFLDRFAEYLRTHELNIKFSDLLADEAGSHTQRDLEENGAKVGITDGAAEGRKKDKGQGVMLAMGLMFGKMMAVLGLGGIGALAMKALGVAMMALMMAAAVGLKSLAEKGHESTHSVQYLTAEGHHHKRRRRRSAGVGAKYDPLHLMYSGWQRDHKQS